MGKQFTNAYLKTMLIGSYFEIIAMAITISYGHGTSLYYVYLYFYINKFLICSIRNKELINMFLLRLQT